MTDRARSVRDEAWRRIEFEASAQAAVAMQRDESTPLVFGAAIAWAHCAYGRTDALSSVHRVGFPNGNDPYTACGEPIPSPARWLVLSPNLARTLPQCRFCAAEVRRTTEEHAA